MFTKPVLLGIASTTVVLLLVACAESKPATTTMPTPVSKSLLAIAVGDFDGGFAIFTVDLDGNGLRNVHESQERLWSGPVWSRNGDRIAFTQEGENVSQRILILDSDGSPSGQISPSSRTDACGPWLNETGNWVAYALQGGGPVVAAETEVADGTSGNEPQRAQGLFRTWIGENELLLAPSSDVFFQSLPAYWEQSQLLDIGSRQIDSFMHPKLESGMPLVPVAYEPKTKRVVWLEAFDFETENLTRSESEQIELWLWVSSLDGSDLAKLVRFIGPGWVEHDQVSTAEWLLVETLPYAPCGIGLTNNWSPDGQHFAVTPWPESDTTSRELLVVDVDDGQTVTVSRSEEGVGFLGWSADGARLLYVSSADGVDQFYWYDVTDRTQEQVLVDLDQTLLTMLESSSLPLNPEDTVILGIACCGR